MTDKRITLTSEDLEAVLAEVLVALHGVRDQLQRIEVRLALLPIEVSPSHLDAEPHGAPAQTSGRGV